MATLTECKRDARPLHYLRKDARTRIYRELYGVAGSIGSHCRVNDPAIDPSRRLSSFWTYQGAEGVYKANVDAAMFNVNERALHDHRLEVLRHYKPPLVEEQRQRAKVIDAIVSTLN